MQKINFDLKGITNWLNANRISLNVSKTEFIIFHKPSKSVSSASLKIKLNEKKVYPSSSTKYLGVLIDEHLLWKPYTDKLIKKLIKFNNILSKIRHYVDNNTIRSLYFALFSSHISYCGQVCRVKGVFRSFSVARQKIFCYYVSDTAKQCIGLPLLSLTFNILKKHRQK